jgi:hypothetical protein
MNISIPKILGYSVAVVCAIFSVLIFSGAVLENIPSTYRMLFGVVVILYGVYRAVLSSTPRKGER